MLKLMKLLLKIVLWPLGILLVLLTVSICYGAVLYMQADMKQPQVDIDLSEYPLTVDTDSLKMCGGNSLVLNRYGIWESRLSGSPADRGTSFGVMAEDLLYFQEKVFVDQIKVFVPSESYLKFLRWVLEIFNRDMASYISDEFREEIYGISLSCTHEFDVFGTPYERQLHYHAAHDIGHMMQEYMLVGCSSFATWDELSADGNLLIGRNFDFWVGDDFARNKLILFVNPDSGYKYASVSWPGMTGVLSGMNEKGLTVTINASKGSIPVASAMPISLLARQILMYAGNIEEAYRIAAENSLFVSESLLIGSAADGRAAIIEKTPDKIALFESDGQSVACTNHFQSDVYADDKHNVRNICESDSKYRYDRLCELIDENVPMTPQKAANVLRNRAGKGGKDVGLANEMTLNQSIAHHSVIFKPSELKMWVTTSPWQSGEMICYDLNEVFSDTVPAGQSLVKEELSIPADSAFIKDIYPRILKHRSDAILIRKAIWNGESLDNELIEDFVANNPEYFESYMIAGDYHEERGETDLALKYWKAALDKEFPYQEIKTDLELNKIRKYDKGQDAAL